MTFESIDGALIRWGIRYTAATQPSPMLSSAGEEDYPPTSWARFFVEDFGCLDWHNCDPLLLTVTRGGGSPEVIIGSARLEWLCAQLVLEQAAAQSYHKRAEPVEASS